MEDIGHSIDDTNVTATMDDFRKIEMRVGRIVSVVAEEDVEALDLEAADRSLFRSFGSCSWREPVDDLEALGLLA